MKANTDPSEDAKYIIARLKANDRIFAQHFFYDDNPKELNISRIRSKIICEIAKSYKIIITKRDFSDYSGINVPFVAVCNVPPVAQCNVPPQKWLQ